MKRKKCLNCICTSLYVLSVPLVCVETLSDCHIRGSSLRYSITVAPPMQVAESAVENPAMYGICRVTSGRRIC